MSQPNEDRMIVLHVAYVTALWSAGVVTFGMVGFGIGIAVAVFWGFVFTSADRSEAFSRFLPWPIVGLALFVLAYLLSPAFMCGFSSGQCRANISQIASALHHYEHVYGSFPPAYVADAEGEPLHSWRVLILPYLERSDLYEKYNFDEPWNGPNNRQLLHSMPRAYSCFTHDDRSKGNTSYVAVVGEQTIWPGSSSRTMEDFRGSYPIQMIECDRGIPWLSPEDLPLETALKVLTDAEPELAGCHREETFFFYHYPGRHIAFWDGTTKFIERGLTQESWNKLFLAKRDFRITEADVNPLSLRTRRLKIDNCLRLLIFAFLIVFPLPWVWR